MEPKGSTQVQWIGTDEVGPPSQVAAARGAVRDTVALETITVAQPWAELIRRSVKPVENRIFTTAHRGPLGIHAARKFQFYALDFREVREALFGHADPSRREIRELEDSLQYSALLSVVWLADTHRTRDVKCCGPWAYRTMTTARGKADARHWLLERPLALPVPYPMSGHQHIRPVRVPRSVLPRGWDLRP